MTRMIRIIAILVTAAGLAGCGSSPFSRAPAAQVAPSASPYAVPGSTLSQYECVQDEGNGRFIPCGSTSH
jgi:predicted small lipoprotein YifL